MATSKAGRGMAAAEAVVRSDRLMYLLYDWPELEHFVRHECGFVVPELQYRACPNCESANDIETYEDIWVWK